MNFLLIESKNHDLLTHQLHDTILNRFFRVYTWPTQLYHLIKWFWLIQYWYYTLQLYNILLVNFHKIVSFDHSKIWYIVYNILVTEVFLSIIGYLMSSIILSILWRILWDDALSTMIWEYDDLPITNLYHSFKIIYIIVSKNFQWSSIHMKKSII